MSKSRLPLVLGLSAAGGVGYYLYSAGGNPRAAENKFESDIHKASAKVKGNLPTEGDVRGAASKAGAQVDKTFNEVDKQVGKLKSNTEAYAKDAKAEALKAVDKFDAKVEEGAAKAKSGVSSWFSSGNK